MNQPLDFRAAAARLNAQGQLTEASPSAAPQAPMVPGAAPAGLDFRSAAANVVNRSSGFEQQALTGEALTARPGPTTERVALMGTTRMGPTVENAQALTILRRADRLLSENATPEVVAEVRRIARETQTTLPLAARTYVEQAARASDERRAALLTQNPALRQLTDQRGYADLVTDLDRLAAVEQAAGSMAGRFVLSPASRELVEEGGDPRQDLNAVGGLRAAFERGLLAFSSSSSYSRAMSIMTDLSQIGMTADEIYAGMVEAYPVPEEFIPDAELAIMRRDAQMAADRLAQYTAEDVVPLLAEAAEEFASVGALRALGEQLGRSDTAIAFSQSIPESDSLADGFVAFFTAAEANPEGAAQYLGETFLESAPTLINSLLVGVVTRSPALASLTAGASSFRLEEVNTAMEYLAEQGFTINTVDDATAVLQNSELMAEAARRGLARGVIIGALDAVSGGISGVALSRSPVADVALQAGVQGTLAGTGEALGGLAATGEVNWTSVALEALVDVLGTPVEIGAVGLRGFGARAQERRQEERVNRALDELQGANPTTAAQRAEEAAAALETTRAAIEETRTFARDPDAVRELLQEAGDQEVTIPAAEIDRLYQEGTLTDADIEYLQVEEELTQQGELSGDVSVAASRLLTLEGDSFSALVDNVRVRPDALTVAEARDAIANREADIERLQATLQQAQAEVTEVADLARRVADDLAQAAPQYTAGQRGAMGRLLAERYAARATLFGPEVTAQTLYADDRVKFERQAAPGAQALEQRAASVGMRTPEFERWFGESRVVDEAGQPLVVYHGTRSDVPAFSQDMIGARFPFSDGFYFTSSPEAASVYADSAANAAVGWNPASPFARPVVEGASVIPVYISMQNPLIVEGEFSGENAVDGTEVVAQARAAGNDGVIVRGTSGDLYVAFRPEQIKSIFNPTPTDAPGILEQGSVADSTPEQDAQIEADVEAGATLEAQEAEIVARVEAAGGEVLDFDQLDALVSDDLVPVLTADDLVGMKIFPTIADRTAAAALYRGIEGAELDIAVPLLGGPLFPLRLSNWVNDVVWANRGAAVKGAKESRLAEGATHMMVLMGDQNMHISNTTVSYAYLQTFFAKMNSANPPDVEAITAYLQSWQADAKPSSAKTERVRRQIREFPGFGDKRALLDYTHRISFEARKKLMQLFATKEIEGMGGPPVKRILDDTREQALTGMNWGDGVLIVQLDRGAGGGSFVDLGTEGTTPHPDFPLGMRGKVVGRLETPLNWRTLWSSWIMENESKENLRRAFETKRPIVEVTPQLAAQVADAAAPGIQTPLHARLVTSLIGDEMRRSGVAKNKGGIGPQDYLNEAAIAGVTPVRPDVQVLNAAIKAGEVQLARVGDARVFYGAEMVDGAMRLTSLVNNERGTEGVGETVAILDAMRSGVTEAVADVDTVVYDLLLDLGFTTTDTPGLLRLEGGQNGRAVEDYFGRGPAGLLDGRAGRAGSTTEAAFVRSRGEGAGDQSAARLIADAGSSAQDGADALSSRARSIAEVVANLSDAAIDNLGLTARDRANAAELTRGGVVLEQPAEGPQTPERGQVGAPRGAYILPKRDGDANVFQFTASADPSTFVHEVGHMFLYQMVRDLSDARLSETGRAQLEQQIRATRSWFRSNSEQAYTDLGKLAKDARRRASRLAAGPEKEQANLRALRLEAAYDRARQGGGAAYMQQVANAFLDPSAQGYDEAAEVVFHELWARGFEKYLGSGSAPSAALRTVFARFAKYIANVYRSLRQLNVEISPEVADVFDRLLATDAAIAEVRRGSVYRLSPGVLDGATPNEAQELRRLAAEAETEAMTQIARREQNALNQKARAQRAARREQLTADITEQVAAEPVYTAISILTTGSTPNGETVVEVGATKLNRSEVVTQAGAAMADAIPKRLISGRKPPEIYIELKDLAPISGFNSIDEMLLALSDETLPSLSDAVRQRVDEQMQAEFGAETDPADLSDEAIEAAQNTRFQELQRLQLRILRRLAAEPLAQVARRQAEKVGAPAAAADQAAEAEARAEEAAAASPREAVQANLARIRAQVQRQANVPQRRAQAAAGRQTRTIQRNVDPAVIQEAARRYVQSIEVRQATPARYQQTANRMSLKIERAIAARDYAEAANLMEQRALNLAIAREAADVQAMVTKQRRRWRDLTGRPNKRLAQSYDVNLVNAIRTVLEPMGFGRSADTNYSADRALADLQEVEPNLYADLMTQISAAGRDAQLAAQADPKQPHRALTVGRLTEILELADQLLANARNSRGLLIEGRRVSFDKIASEAASYVDSRRAVERRESRSARRTTAQRRRDRRGSGLISSLLRIEALGRDLDNGDPRGPITRYLVRPVMAAVDAFHEARLEPIQQLVNALQEQPDLLQYRPIEAAELAPGFSFENRGQLLMALLNSGNESNLRKMLMGGAKIGEVWSAWTSTQTYGEDLDTSRWDAFLARAFADGTITKADMDAVQAIWDIFEGTKSGAQAAHQKMFGYRFVEIEDNLVVTPFGTYRGGYVPAVLDRLSNPEAQNFDAQEVMSQQSTASMFPGAERGFTETRTSATYMLDLDIARLPSHFDRVMRFTHLGPPVQQAARLINHPAFVAQIDRVNPTLRVSALIPWLQRTVQQQVVTPDTNAFLQWAAPLNKALERRVGILIMGGNLFNAAEQLTSVFPALTRIPARHLLAAMTTWRMSGESARRHMIDASPFMAERIRIGSNEILTQLDNLMREPGLLNRVSDFGIRYSYFAQQIVANMMEPTIWLAAERDAMVRIYPKAYAEALARTGNDTEADAEGKKEVYAYADEVVRSTQGSTRPSDVSGVEANTALARLALKFYSYFNMLTNLGKSEIAIAMNSEMGWAGRYGRAFYVYLMTFAATAVVSKLMRVALTGGLDDLEDEEVLPTATSILVGSQVEVALASVPIFGSVLTPAYGRLTESPFDDSVRASAGYGVAGDAIGNIASLLLDIVDEDTDVSTVEGARRSLNAVGLALGLPTNWATKALRYAERVQEGDASPEGLVDYIQGILTGRDGTED